MNSCIDGSRMGVIRINGVSLRGLGGDGHFLDVVQVVGVCHPLDAR